MSIDAIYSEAIALDVTLPTTQVGMLLIQPHLSFSTPLQEPFPLNQECVDSLGKCADRALLLAKSLRPHFIVFPEFSLPGVGSVARICEQMSAPDFPTPTILMGGLTGMSKDDYGRLCDICTAVPPQIGPDKVASTQWINAAVVVVKDDHGQVHLWAQPKISPSWPEASGSHLAMFRGCHVHLFKARFDNNVPFHFLTLICFDWIGIELGKPILAHALDAINASWEQQGSPQLLQWAFVLQHNKDPNNGEFLKAAHRFLTQPNEYPFVDRHNASVVMASTASSTRVVLPLPVGPIIAVPIESKSARCSPLNGPQL